MGETVDSPIGQAVVIGHQVPGQSVTVRSPQGEVARCPLTEVCVTSRRRKERHAKLRRTGGGAGGEQQDSEREKR